MKRRLLSALLALCVASTLLVPVSAEPGVPDEPDENEALFAIYVAKQLYGDAFDVELYGNYGETALTGLNLEIYQTLKTKIETIAKNGGSTEIEVRTFTGSSGELPEDIDTQEKFNTFVDGKLAGLDKSEILDCLLVDCPYELFWFDKTGKSNVDAANKEHAMDMEYSGGAEDGQYSIALTFTFTVVPAYRSAADKPYSVTSALTAVQTAANNAKKIVEDNSSKSDYEKLLTYKNEICRLTSYNSEAADDKTWTDGYGDPWQLIWVFDGKEDTNVVCEGYAKAFQYLCDLSTFTGADTKCYTVTGTTDAGKGSGAHMWNVVTLGGGNYLVDVTNSDEGGIGEDGSLFLAGKAPADSSKNVYTFKIDERNQITYTYDADERQMYGDILNLAGSNYEPPSTKKQPVVQTVPTAPNATYGNKLSDLALTGGTVVAPDGTNKTVAGTWAWVTPNQSVGDASDTPKKFKARFTPTGDDADTYSAVEADVAVTVNKAKINISVVRWPNSNTSTVTYDGKAHSVEPESVPSGVNVTYDPNNSYTYAGDHRFAAILEPKDKTNYEIEGTFDTAYVLKITAANQPVSVQNGTLRKGGNPLDLSTLVSGNEGALTFTLPNDGGTGSTLNGSTLTSGGTTGTVTIDVAAAVVDENGDGKNEYNAYSGTLTVEIVEKLTANLTVTQSNTTYKSALADPVYNKPAGAGEAAITYTGTTAAGSSYNSSTKPTDAGSYTVTVRCETSDTIYTGSADFTIAPKSISGAVIALDSTDLVYNKSEQTKAVSSVTVDGDTLDPSGYTVTNNTGTNAGTYTLTVTAKENTNYTGSKTEEFTIAPKPVSVASATAANRVYNGSKDVSVTVTFDDRDIAEQTVTGKMSDADAGTGKAVAVTVTLSNTNYTLTAQPANVTVDIGKALAPTLADVQVSHRYSAAGTGRCDLSGKVAGATKYTLGTVQNPSNIIKDINVSSAGVLTYTRVPQGSFVSGTQAAVQVTIESKNYENATVKVVIALTDKLTQAPLTITTTGPATYGQDLPLSVQGGTGAGEVTYAVVNGTGQATVAGNILTPVQAGTVTVTATKAADDEYMEISSAAVIIDIDRGTPVVRPTYTAITANGKTLADAHLSLPVGTTPAGTIAWEDSTATAVNANARYNWIFTPDDTVNWKTVTGSIVLWNYRPTRPGGTGSGSTGTGTGTVTGGTGSGHNSPSRPSGSSGGSTTASGGGTISSNTSSATASPSVTVSNGTATAAVSASMGQRLVEQAVRGNSAAVVIAPKVDRTATSTAVTIPGETVESIGSRTRASLKVNSPVASVTIPNSALASLAAGGDVTVSASSHDGVLSVDIASNGSSVKQLSGVTAEVPASRCSNGTVAMLVASDGSTTVIRKSIADPTKGTVSVPLDGSAKLVIADNSKAFADVPANNWAAGAVSFISGHEIMNGTDGASFSPSAPMTRGMLAAVLHNIESNPRASGSAAFSDVGAEWYAGAVRWAADKGIVSGYSDGRFGPNDMVTREQLAVMLYRYAGQPAVSGGTLSFADAGQVSAWAESAIRWAVGAGILSGDGSRLNPGGQATRAEAASMLMRFMINMER